ncbi:regulatory protein, luxR family [Frankineae bacterium MT45]|nr:regulatory protein, luxR family [Frankineae bacterium MT45]
MLVPRSTEWGLLQRLLGTATEDRNVQTALLVGEGGVGKSHLAFQLTQRARQEGLYSLVGRADEFDRGAPYAVFRDALRQIGGPALTPAAKQALERARAAIDRPVNEASSGVVTEVAVDESTRVEQVLHAFTELLELLGTDGPVLLALEDMHCADAASVTLYGLLSRQLRDVPAVIVLTMRPGHPDRTGDLLSFVQRLEADDRATVIELGALRGRQIAHLISTELNAIPSQHLTTFVTERSGGNPLFAKALVAQLANEAAIDLSHEPVTLIGSKAQESSPAGQLLGRFFSAGGTELRMGKALSIFARFPLTQLDILQRLTDLDADAVTATFDSLVAKKLLAKAADGGYRFVHPMMKEALYDAIGDAERRGMHAVAAEMLMQRRHTGIDVDIFDLATHISNSISERDPAAAAVAIEAAEAAWSRSPLLAAEWYHRAADLLPTDSEERIAVLIREAEGLILSGRSAPAADLMEQLVHTVPPERRSIEFVRLASRALFDTLRLTEAIEVLESARPEPSEVFGIQTRLANLLSQAGRSGDAEKYYVAAMSNPDPAINIARTVGYINLLSFASATGRSDDVAALRRILQTHFQSFPPTIRAELKPTVTQFAVQGPAGLGEAESDFAEVQRLREGIVGVSSGGFAEVSEVMIGWLRGRWSEALASAQATLPMLETFGNERPLRVIRAITTLILSDRGELDEAAAVCEKLRGTGAFVDPLEVVARARIARLRGDSANAQQMLRSYYEFAARARRYVYLSLVAHELVDVLLESNPTQASVIAKRNFELLRPVSWSLLDVYSLRALGAAVGDVQAAHSAALIAQREGLTFEHAKCQLVLGELGTDADTNLAAAFDGFDAVGATPWRQRTASAKSSSDAARHTGNQPTVSLTPSETNIARLVSEGMSNKQVAAALHYSAKTVEVYLSRIYTKTGHAGRYELIRAVYQGALVLDESPN